MASTRRARRNGGPAAARPAPPAATVGVGDVFATAFARYAGGFVTFGLLAGAFALPALGVVEAVRAAGAGGQVEAAVDSFAVSAAYLAYAGAVTSVIGRRLRVTLVPVVLTAIPVAVPLALLVRLLGQAAIFPLPFVLPFLALAPIAAGAGDAAGLAACRRAFVLVARRGYTRALGATAGLELLGALLFLGFWVAFAPIGATGREVATVAAMALVFWPLSALVFRNLYGALDGRLVVRPGG